MFTLRDVQNRFDEMDVNYRILNDGTIGLLQTGKQNFRYMIWLAIEGTICRAVFYTGVHFPEYNMKVLSKINKFNKIYKMYSFCVNEEDENELVLKGYIDIEYTNDIESVVSLIALGQRVLDDLYPETQKIIWSN